MKHRTAIFRGSLIYSASNAWLETGKKIALKNSHSAMKLTWARPKSTLPASCEGKTGAENCMSCSDLR